MGQRWGTLGVLASAWSWGQKGLRALCTHRQLSDDALIQMGKKTGLCLLKKGHKNVVVYTVAK